MVNFCEFFKDFFQIHNDFFSQNFTKVHNSVDKYFVVERVL